MIKEVKAHLKSEGISEENVDQLAEVIQLMMKWGPENPGNPDNAEAIIAFSYSYRFSENGNRLPGPINQSLAKQVLSHYDKKKRRIFTQWEITDSINSSPRRYNRKLQADIVSINPKVNLSKGCTEYLSTEGALKEAINRGLDPKKYSPILVIAQRFHLPRCIWLAELFGFKTVSDPDNMPRECDPLSGQFWTHTLMRQLVGDLISRLATYRDKVLSPHQL